MHSSQKTLKYTLIASLSVASILAIFSQNIYAEVIQSTPIASIAPQTSSECNKFTFDATQSQIPENSNTSYLWSFGDGNTSTEPIVTHIYHRSGDYTVNLSICDNSKFECNNAATSKTVRVNAPPKASFFSQDQACINEDLIFDATTSHAADGKSLNYVWNFGDSEIREGSSYVTKSYKKGGDYTVRLAVNDLSGSVCSSDTKEKIIHINEPPTAEAGNDVIFKCESNPEDMIVNFNASVATGTNNDSLEYLWDFGDGFKEKGRQVSHSYARPGHYDARLIVSDHTASGCGVNVDFVTVKIGQPPKADAGEDIAVCTNEDVHFDGSHSYIEKKGTVSAQWTLGEGLSKAGLYATYRYTRPGTYEATLSLEDKLNNMCPVSRDTRIITVNSAPTVKIISTTSACVDTEVSFDASSATDPDGDALDYYWNFGDGSTFRGGAIASHQYDQGGNYRVSLVVDDKKGSSCSTVTAITNIRINTPPIADARSNAPYCTGEENLFSAKDSSDPDGDEQLSYIWDFGDGTKAQTDTVKHAYKNSGSYNVSLIVDDRQGTSCSQSTDSFVAVVKEAVVPIINIR